MDFFSYNSTSGAVEVNKVGILLDPDFAALFEDSRNINKNDKTGKFKEKAQRELVFIYTYLDWQGPYAQYPEDDKFNAALNTSGLSKEDVEDPTLQQALKKYDEMQNASLSIRLLKSAMRAIDTVIHYLDNIDVNERDLVTGKPIFKTKDLIAEIKGCKDLVMALEELENQVKKGLDKSGGLRGGATPGYYDGE